MGKCSFKKVNNVKGGTKLRLTVNVHYEVLFKICSFTVHKLHKWSHFIY